MYVYCRYLFDCFRANRKKNYFHTWCGKRLTKNATRGVDLLIAHTGFNSLRSMTHFLLFFNWINDSNWTEWNAVWAEIICVISKLNECAAWVRFGITIMISDQNCTTRGSIATLWHSFWNYPNTRLGQFKYSIDAALSQFEIKLIYFWEGKSKSLGNKSCKICHMILFVFHCPAIWLVTLNKPWDQIGCFVFSVTFSLALQGPLVYTSTIVLAINFWTRQSACTKSVIHLFIVIIPKANADSLNCSDEGLTPKCQLFYPLRWPICIFNTVVNTKLLAILSHQCSTTVS